MKKRNIIVFDTETTGLKAGHAEIIQLSAVHVDPIRLEVTDTFDSLMKPLTPETASQKAMETHGHSMDDLEAAPHPKTVWKDFTDFVNRYNPENNMWTAPIPVGHNVKFDMSFVNVYCQKYGPWNKKNEEQSLFYYNPMDTFQMAHMWFENDRTITNCRLETLMEYFGVDPSEAHNSLFDTRFTAELYIRFVRLHRKLREDFNVKFKGCMKGWK